jgi:hypothetical protein
VPEEKKVNLRRGLPPAEYQNVRRLVKAGKTTWKKAEKAGVCEPVCRGKKSQAMLDRINRKGN